MSNVNQDAFIWVFNGPRSSFPSGIFSSKDLAERWIQTYRLTGTLTHYPIDVSVYDWAVSRGFFTVSKDEQREPSFVEKFTSASLDHFHYEDGSLA